MFIVVAGIQPAAAMKPVRYALAFVAARNSP